VVLDADCLRQYRDFPPDVPVTPEALAHAARSSRSVRYDRVTELRVAARSKSRPEQIVAERDGERRRIPMRVEDLMHCGTRSITSIRYCRCLRRAKPALGPSRGPPPG
jgi:hypothetical protein